MKKPKNPKPSRKAGSQQIQEILGELSEIDGENPSAIKAKLESLNKTELIEVAITATQTTFHSGPLPPASELEGYEQACIGAADRIISMAEAEQQFSHSEISKSETRTFADRKMGFFLGAGLLALLIGGAIACLFLDKERYAIVFLGTAVLSVIGKFIPSAIRIIKGGSD